MPRRNWTLQKYKTPGQADLFGKTNRQKGYIATLLYDIEIREQEIKRVEHWLFCERCFFEVVITVERYPNRGPWYIDAQYEDMIPEEYPDAPKREDYEIGWYGNDNLPGTREFIRARLLWVTELLLKEVEALQKELKEAKEASAWEVV
jgi:hypothetical protein